jgi:hypothetical protein
MYGSEKYNFMGKGELNSHSWEFPGNHEKYFTFYIRENVKIRESLKS